MAPLNASKYDLSMIESLNHMPREIIDETRQNVAFRKIRRYISSKHRPGQTRDAELSIFYVEY